jgi:hypothetical protein
MFASEPFSTYLHQHKEIKPYEFEAEFTWNLIYQLVKNIRAHLLKDYVKMSLRLQ